MDEREQRLAYAPIGKLLFKFSVPAIIGMLVNAFYNIVDRIFIGKIAGIGADALTGVGVTFPLINIILAFSLLIGVGTSARISIFLGQKRHEDAERALGTSLALAVSVGLLLMIAGLVFSGPLLSLFGASATTLPYAQQYAQIYFMGTIFNLISMSMSHGIRGSGSPQYSAITQVIGGIANVILDPIFIFVFHMGVRGAAIATIISQTISALLVLSFFLRGKSVLRLRWRFVRLQKDFILRIFSIGISPFSMQIAASMVSALANTTLRNYGGDMAVGAMTVISSVSTLFLMPVLGMNQGLQPIIGYNYGAKAFDRVKKALHTGIAAASCIMLLVFIAIQLFPGFIIRIFNDNPDLLRIGTQGLRIFLAMTPFLGLQILSTNYFQSIGRAKVAMFLSLLRQVIILIPMYLILPRFLGLLGVWMAGPVSDAISVVITVTIIVRELRSLPSAAKES